MSAHSEVLEGYVVDIACLRKYPQDELLGRAKEHTRKCALMGHCVESGYGLIDDEGRLALLDTGATPKVVSALEGAAAGQEGIRLRVTRESEGEEMTTTGVDLA